MDTKKHTSTRIARKSKAARARGAASERIERLMEELSDALGQYANGSFVAFVGPADTGGLYRQDQVRLVRMLGPQNVPAAIAKVNAAADELKVAAVELDPTISRAFVHWSDAQGACRYERLEGVYFERSDTSGPGAPERWEGSAE